MIPRRELRARVPEFVEAAKSWASSAYVHLDLDVLDPSEGRANAYAAPEGLTVDDVIWTLSEVAAGLPLGAVSLTAYDPILRSGRADPHRRAAHRRCGRRAGALR